MIWPFRRKETRSTNQAPGGDSYWLDFQQLRTGPVNAKTAQSVAAVYACVSAITETVASLPLHLLERGDNRTKATDHPLYRILHDAPNEYQTALEFREWMQAAVLLRGNAYARIHRDHAGQVESLVPLTPDRVALQTTPTGRVMYDVTTDQGKVETLLPHEVFHLRHRAGDNVLIGVSPIQAAREVVELAINEREHGNALFRNGARPSGLLKFATLLTTDQRDNLKKSWAAGFEGVGNRGKTPILEQGADYVPVTMTSEDAEWIKSRRFSVEEVARLFRVPPTIIGDLTHGNYSNSVEMARTFVTLTLRRPIASWEQAITTQLLSKEGQAVYVPKHSVEGLLRGDARNRAEFYKLGIDAGWLTVNEARELEDLPPLQEVVE